ncbi:hypothetical protein D6817_01625 [Candidatus Pacearchaeota archaeon]|nr:MAG: hypothetical protein D6817_01625 [Candidatus Pacearchaeota archaeon]
MTEVMEASVLALCSRRTGAERARALSAGSSLLRRGARPTPQLRAKARGICKTTEINATKKFASFLVGKIVLF